MTGKPLKDFTIDFTSVIIKASSKEKAEERAKQMVAKGEVEVECVEETDWETLGKREVTE